MRHTSLGERVFYVDTVGTHAPALVTRVWDDNMVNLTVFADGSTNYVTSVPHDNEMGYNSFHFADEM